VARPQFLRARPGGARAGVAVDRVLLYATGGLAYTDDNTGWVAGGGVEWALPVNWFGSSAVTFGVEGLWLSFDEDDDFGGTVGTFTPTFSNTLPFITQRVPPPGSGLPSSSRSQRVYSNFAALPAWSSIA